ncbi:hypothetical protein M0805_009611 [Coniferiporia weirii]|nr:hypothetical protein M0805_009611 [Coniferiporia weirii]
MSTSTATGLPALDNTMGALYLGVVLWGVGSVQLYYYLSGFSSDPWRVKAHVLVVWAFDTVHQGLVTHACYIYLVTQYGNPAYLLVIVPTLEVMVLMSAIVCLLVQSFLVHRVWTLSQKNVMLTGVLSLLVIVGFITTATYFGKGVQLTSFVDVVSIDWLSKLTNSLAAATDAIIAFVLIFLLHRARTGFQKSETMINRLILFTINTGLLTSLCAVLTVVFVSVYPNNYVYITVYFCVSRLYTNCLLATLNSRKNVYGSDADDSEAAASMPLNARAQTADVASRGMPRFALKVDTNTSFVDDQGFKYPPRSAADSDTDTYKPYDRKMIASEV